MVGIISIVILVLSLGCMAVILLRKIPILNKLPETTGDFPKFLLGGIKAGVKKIPVVKNFSYELYLQKVLSKFRVLTLRTESKTGNWLERLRQKTNKNNHIDEKKNEYWDELKKAKNGK